MKANLSGIDTHGVWHLPLYVDAINDGFLMPSTKPEVLDASSVGTLISGNWTFGHVTAGFAMETAIAAAKDDGMAVAGVVRSHHVGRVGHYVEMAAEAGMIGIAADGGLGELYPVSVPHGGRKPVLSTNPVAMGFPAGSDAPMMFDFATTTVSGMKLLDIKRRGEKLAAGHAVDAEGNPTDDPDVAIDGEGAHLPFGGHKGYSLMMAVEYLGRILTGSDTYAQEGRGGRFMAKHGVLMIVIRADLFRSLEDFSTAATEMQERVRSVPPAPGFEEVLAPGDIESRSRVARRRDGIPVADEVWNSIVEVAETLGVEVE